jgi:hypothetical protein
MAMSRRLVGGVALLVGGALAGCSPPDRGDAQTTRTSGALTTSLFQPSVAYATGSPGAAVAIGDLDGDGRNDVAVLTSLLPDAANDFMVNVFLQNADGSLKPRVKYPVGATGSSIDIGDVNGDGRADVVVGLNRGAASLIGVLLQNASGTLDAMVPYPTSNSYQVKIGDFNGDGRMDIAGINFGGGLSVFLQTASGTLASPVTYAVPSGGFDELDAGDVDGDGRTDLVVMSGQGFAFPNVKVLLQLADGTFGAPVSYSVGSNIGTHGVALGDTNGDGRTDIVVSYGGSRPASSIARFLQTAPGTFAPAVSYASWDSPSALVLADVDGDGRKDALVAHDSSGRLGVHRQFPSGDFGSEELSSFAGSSRFSPQGLAVGDIDGDGRPDAVLAASNTTNGLIVFRHVPDTSLALMVSAPTGGPYYLGAPLTIRWSVGDTVPITGFDVSASFNNGVTYAPITGCTGLPATATECAWTPPGPTGNVRVRVTAADGAGNTVSAESTFTLATPSISVSLTPASPAVGSTATIFWNHNLPSTGTVLIELSRDGGASYETLAAAAPISNNGSTQGSFTWPVTGPSTTTARLRVTSNDASLPASASLNFTIAPSPTPSISVSLGPIQGSVQYIGLGTTISWSHNLPSSGTVRIELSRDGGSTYETLTASAPISNAGSTRGSFAWTVTGPASTTARLRVTSNEASPSVSGSIDFTIAAVPTLTVTVTTTGGVAYTPWVNVAWSARVPGDNVRIEITRDGGATYQSIVNSYLNVETMWSGAIPGPGAADARIRVTSNGLVPVSGTSDSFTLVQPSVAITSPTAGSTAYVGTASPITWSTTLPASAPALIELSRDGGSTYQTLANAPNTGSFAWTATGPAVAAARVRVTVTGVWGSTVASSGTFAIVAPSLAVTSPAAGAAFYAGTPQVIAWSTNLPASAPALIELSRDGGSSYEVLAASAPNTGSFAWVASAPASGAAIARVTIGPASATSGAFAIVAPSLTVTGPAAGAAFYAGTLASITWTTNVSAPTVLVEVSRDGGSTFETLAAAAPNTGRFDWLVTGPDSSTVVARVTATDPVAASGSSGAFAIVTPALTVTGPVAGTQAYAGTPVTIAWTDNLPASDPVSIELSRDGGATFELLATSANTGSFIWTASGPAATDARVRVTSGGAVSVSNVGASFAIVVPTVTVTSPAAGESWAIGTARTISWTSNLPAGTTVAVALSRDGGASWTTLASAASATGSLAWTAVGPATSAAIVRVSANGGIPAVGTSGAFSIGNPAVAVTSPAADASWTIGTAQTITWTSNLLPTATVKIQISRNGGSTFTTLSSSAPNTGSFAWTATGGATTTAIVKVTAVGLSASAVSGTFSIVAASVTVTAPNTAVTWAIGSTQTITWTHNVGPDAQFQIEVSRGGVWSVIAPAVPGDSATSGSYLWTVTGPKASNAKVRVTWTDGTAKDTSVAFKIN